MPRRRVLFAAAAATALAAGGPALASSGTGSVPTRPAHPHFFAALTDSPAQRRALNPPTLPCPVAVNSILAATGQIVNCHLPELPATGLPVPGNMAYYGGAVQTHPHVYLVLWGWGQKGAFPASATCSPEKLPGGAVLPCDPDGAGRRMADFVSQIGGTAWAGVQTQYYQTVGGRTTHISNPRNFLAGVWVDDTNPISAQVTYTQMAQEAQRAAAHFRVDPATLVNDDFIIAQPANFSDPQAASQGYCAFHDYTEPGLEGGIYNSVRPGLVYTNMPYVLNQGAGCGQNLVNPGAAGKLDGVTVALGHEIMEAETDPGAEDVLPGGQTIGGWYDVVDSDENGDKCAYVGDDQGLTDPSGLAVPGGASDITGNAGGRFAVQSLWSNAALAGAGYCAGTAHDLAALPGV